jgi:hypothetical protein
VCVCGLKIYAKIFKRRRKNLLGKFAETHTSSGSNIDPGGESKKYGVNTIYGTVNDND